MEKEVRDYLIEKEYRAFKSEMYANKNEEQRKELDQFFTPYQITIPMLDKFDVFEHKNILDPTCGSGNLLAACIIAGADYDKVYGNDYDETMVEQCKHRLKTIHERLLLTYDEIKDKKEFKDFKYDPEIEKTGVEFAEKLKSNTALFKDFQIHRGNALQKQCISYFAEDYSTLYDFTRISDTTYGQIDLHDLRANNKNFKTHKRIKPLKGCDEDKVPLC